MKIAITFEVEETDRRAVNARFGEDSPAPRDRMQRWIESTVDTALDQLRFELAEQDGENS